MPSDGATWPAVSIDPATHQAYTGSGMQVRSPTGGLFHDFSTGAPGVAILGNERPCPSFIDSTSASSGSTLVYADPSEVPLAGMPMWAKMTSTTGAGQKLTFIATSYQEKAIDCGRMYVYFPQAIAQTRLAQIFTEGNPIYIRLNTAQTVSVLDSTSSVQGTSAALSAGTAYRIEWRIVLSGGNAVVRLVIYPGHSTVALSDFTTPSFSVGGAALTVSAELGNANAANLAGKFLYVGAPAVNCDTFPGPYLGARSMFANVVAGAPAVEVIPNGDYVFRANRDYHIGDGGTELYLIQEGDITARIGTDGIYVGPNTGVGDPAGISDADTKDITMDAKNRRSAARGGNWVNLHDPPDNAYTRQELINSGTDPAYGAVGTGATTIAGATGNNPDVTFTDLTLYMQNRGHGIKIDGVSYNIAEVLGPSSAKLKPKPTASGSGLSWSLKWFPYPLQSQLCGTNEGLTVGEPARMTPMAHAPIASGSSGVSTTSGSAVVDISALSAANKAFWTVGRRLLINDDVSLMALAEGHCFKILSVAGDGNSVTLNANVPATLSNKKWNLAGANTDGFAQKTLHPLSTFVADNYTDIVNFSSTRSIGAVEWTISSIRHDQLWNNVGGDPVNGVAHNQFRWFPDGWFQVTEGGVDSKQFKIDGQLFRPHDGMNVISRGYMAETARLQACTAASAPPHRIICGGLIGLSAGEVITYIIACVEVAGAGTAPARIELAIVGATGQLRRTTGNVASSVNWGTTGPQAFALTTPYTLTVGGSHYLAILKDGAFSGTDVQLARVSNLASTMKAYSTFARAGFRQDRTGTPTFPSPVTMADMGANEFFWMACA